MVAPSKFIRFWLFVVLFLSGTLGPAVGRAQASAPAVHSVAAGDTLYSIAGRYEVGVQELASSNGLSLNDTLYVGQQLVIPGVVDPNTTLQYATDPRVPNPLPSLPVLPQETPAEVVSLTYAQIIKENVPVYSHPAFPSFHLPAKRYLGAGYLWVSVMSEASYGDQDYYEINPGEYVAADALRFYSPSRFHGVALAAQPERPFAWILQTAQPRLTPGGELNPEAPAYGRYQLVQIFSTERVNDELWYLVGPNQWVNQRLVGKVTPAARPAGVAAGASWVDVNLFEQTMAVYAGDQMVYATLISSGLVGWDTPQGLTQVWQRTALGKMSGADGRPDYYFLEDVPWALYFNQAVALHTAYWHNSFGYPQSHGCVNLAPLDAKWLWDWAPSDLWVWVH